MTQPDFSFFNGQMFEDVRPELVFAPGALLLPGFASEVEDALLAELARIQEVAPFRQMTTPGGHQMSVAMTNCGQFGWVTDRTGYRYDRLDPLSHQPWPAMPHVFLDLATRAAQRAGYERFEPDACLVNRYLPGAKMGLHQDKDEKDFSAPIVSVSLGLPAAFLFGGAKRTDPTQVLPLKHGDVVVWGGHSRLFYHGIRPLKEGFSEKLGGERINLTFRKVN